MITNYNSYRYEYLFYEKGLFDNYIDCIYIATLENSNRKESYLYQLNKFKLHKNIIIQYNKGFKNIKKKLLKQTTIQDINDVYYHIFLHAKKNNYSNIIVFEDDFFFINITQKIVDDIGIFINNNNYDIYNLGTSINISYPYTLKHHKSIISTSAQGVIYSNKYFNKYIYLYNIGFDNQNDLIWNKFNIIKYKYYKPLCFQLYTYTENLKNWKLSNIAYLFIKLVRLNKHHQPGFTILNILGNIPFIIFIICISYFNCIK